VFRTAVTRLAALALLFGQVQLLAAELYCGEPREQPSCEQMAEAVPVASVSAASPHSGDCASMGACAAGAPSLAAALFGAPMISADESGRLGTAHRSPPSFEPDPVSPPPQA